MVWMVIMVHWSHCTSPQSATYLPLQARPRIKFEVTTIIHILDDRVCVFMPVDIRHTVFWLAAYIYGIYAVAFWLEDMCVPQDALIGWKDLWIMQFCIPDAMYKQQQMCAAYTSQNSLFHPTRPALLAMKPLEESSLICSVGRGLKTKSWNIKTRIAELGVFMHKFAIENDPKP